MIVLPPPYPTAAASNHPQSPGHDSTPPYPTTAASNHLRSPGHESTPPYPTTAASNHPKSSGHDSTLPYPTAAASNHPQSPGHDSTPPCPTTAASNHLRSPGHDSTPPYPTAAASNHPKGPGHDSTLPYPTVTPPTPPHIPKYDSTPPPTATASSLTNRPQSPARVMPQLALRQPVVTSPNISNKLRPYSVMIQCPKCLHRAPTLVTYSLGTDVCLLALLLFFICGPLGCCLIPFCVDDLNDVEHRCSLCKHYLGCYKRI